MLVRKQETRVHLLPGTLDLLILGTLSQAAQHGHAIAQTIQQKSREVLQVRNGALYKAVDRLVKNEWISHYQGLSRNKLVKVYKLQTEGRQRLIHEARRWEQVSAAINRVLEWPPVQRDRLVGRIKAEPKMATGSFLPGTLDLLILCILNSAPTYAQAIIGDLRLKSGSGLHVDEGRVYNALRNLVTRNLIADRWNAARRVRIYRLTPMGRQQMNREKRCWKQVARAVRDVLQGHSPETPEVR